MELEPLLAAFDVCAAMLLKGWLLLSSVLLPGCTCLLAPSRRRRISTSLAAVSDVVETSIACINACARDRSAKPDDVVAALAVLRAERPRPPTRESFAGTWELVWNDKLAKVPVVNGYMPNRETLVWDLDGRALDLRVETLPFLPEIKIRGENLTYSDGVLNLHRRRQGPINLGRVPRGRRPLRGVVRDGGECDKTNRLNYW